jgi:hypothetical protein
VDKWATGGTLPAVDLSISPPAFIVGLPLHLFPEAIRLGSGKLKDVRFVSQAVEQRCRQAFVAEDLCPVGKAQVGMSYLEYESVLKCSPRQ